MEKTLRKDDNSKCFTKIDMMVDIIFNCSNCIVSSVLTKM